MMKFARGLRINFLEGKEKERMEFHTLLPKRSLERMIV